MENTKCKMKRISILDILSRNVATDAGVGRRCHDLADPGLKTALRLALPLPSNPIHFASPFSSHFA